MKKIIVILLSAIVLSSCGNYGSSDYIEPDYNEIAGPNGNVMVVRDVDGSQFVMDPILFNAQYNTGGYMGVINYYHAHPTIFMLYVYSNYSSYRVVHTYNFPRQPRTYFKTTYRSNYNKYNTYNSYKRDGFGDGRRDRSASNSGFGKGNNNSNNSTTSVKTTKVYTNSGGSSWGNRSTNTAKTTTVAKSYNSSSSKSSSSSRSSGFGGGRRK